MVPDQVSVKDALFFAWSMPISVLITGAENVSLLEEKIELARTFVSLSENDRAALIAKIEQMPYRKDIEYYKKV